MASLQKFQPFAKLPLELREAIWAAALPTRVVRLMVDDLNDLSDRNICGSPGLSRTKCYLCGGEVKESDCIYDEARYGKCIAEDTRSIPEKDLRMLVHRLAIDLDGRLKRQTQLAKYGFSSARVAPTIGHVLKHDDMQHGGFDDRDFRSSIARPLLDYGLFESQIQSQLQWYGFTNSRPMPILQAVSWKELDYSGKTPRIRHYSLSNPPALLFVCRESRRVAQQCGYNIAFATRCSRAQIWFSFQTDFLYLHTDRIEFKDDDDDDDEHEDLGVMKDIDIKDRRRVRNLVVDYFSPSDEGMEKLLGMIVRSFANLEQLVVLASERRNSQAWEPPVPPLDPDWRLVDPSLVELFGDLVDFTGPILSDLRQLIRPWQRNLPGGRSFYEHLAGKVEESLAQCHDADLLKGIPYWEIPKVRYALLITASQEQELHVARARYWGERGEHPPLELLAEMAAEDRDARHTKQIPSAFEAFEAEHADDLQAYDESRYYGWG